MIDSGSGLGMIAIFFLYGLAFFLMGFAILGEVLRAERSRLATSLLFLALFGLVHSLVEWTDMFGLVVKGFGLTGWEGRLEGLHSFLLPLSLLPLLIFGVKLLADSLEGAWAMWLLPPALVMTWLTVGFLLPSALPDVIVDGGGVPSLGWQEAWARYLLYLPGSLLAAIALAFQRRVFVGLGMKDIAGYASLGAAAFVLNAIVAGLIVPRAPFPPAIWVNYETFTRVVGVPVQLFRALTAFGVAFAVVQMMRFRDLTQRRLLEAAHEEAFRLQEQARHQAEEWGSNLERAVKEKTEQLEALYRQLQELAIIQERERIAREMHDSLAQMLGYIRMELSRVSGLLAAGELAAAATALEGLDRTAELVYADVRDTILGLRSTVGPGRDLLATLRDYLHTFSLQHQIKATLQVEPGVDYPLSPQVEVQVIRIIQEALTNVRKHSGADRVVVDFSREGDGVRISVADNGRGFDITAVAKNGVPRFGLATMRERAESVGGKLAVNSSPGSGTRVVLWVPSARGKGAGNYEAAKTDGGGRPEPVP